MAYRNLVFLFLAAGAFSILLSACRQEQKMLKKIPAARSGIHFNNIVIENDSINPIDLEYLYNGGGVAAGDFNNDGLPDLYFTASTTFNKLYLNEGDLRFSDITETAGVAGEGIWSNAASVVDINNDGWKDIYVCATIKKDPMKRKNLLYINQGLNANNIPVFKEMAESYGLADTAYAVHAAFFDFDNDGDLDMYLANTRLAGRNSALFFNDNTGDTLRDDYDKLFRNDWNGAVQHPVFTDITADAGIGAHGFALGLAVADINNDGWKDIYVANDFLSNDELYINNKNGTFTNMRDRYFKHTSQNAMGTDIADINNDGLADVITVDMNPEDNFRKKKNMGSANYFLYQQMRSGHYALQYVRNTLQLNQGPSIGNNDTIGEPVFSEIGFYAGVAETDWSWNPSLADFDNDGYRDIIITNGYPRDVTDHDFSAYRQKASPSTTRQQLIDQIPQIKIANYVFRNTNGLQFENVTGQWGLDEPGFSSGAVYVDLDSDGDLDYVINNINEKASVYENTLNGKTRISANFLQVKFKGGEKNRNGLGAIAAIYYNNGHKQVYENTPYRGYLSTVNDIAHFGLGKTAVIDSLVVSWPGGYKQILKQIAANQVLEVNIRDAAPYTPPADRIARDHLFTDITNESGIHYRHGEVDFVDFNYQRLLPHKLSQYGPPLAAGDVYGNGLDAIVIGGNTVMDPAVLAQQPNGTFLKHILPAATVPDARKPETMGMLLFDADNDGDLDIYMASGSSEFTPDTKNYQDRFYINQGNGKFTIAEDVIPVNYSSKSCVKAADYDHDGDLDLFIGGRVLPGKYPQPVSSIILRNDSGPGTVKFTDVTGEVAHALIDIGLVCDALWTDFDNDGWEDLVIAGEWMPLVFLKNNRGKFKRLTDSGIEQHKGWWSSLVAGDFDNDGDMDYMAGNLGENSFYRAGAAHPVRIYGKDFDKNGGYDIITTVYLKDEQGIRKEFPAQNRDEMMEQLPGLKKRFITYKSFGKATVHDMFTKEELQDALVLEANNMKSCFIKNMGNGKFECHPLPAQAQLAPLYGMVADDFNGDGNLDVVMNGNDFGTEVSTGRYDALNGLVLLGDGNGNFSAQTILQSGIFIPGDGKALVRLRQAGSHYLLAASQNQNLLKIFRQKKDNRLIALQPGELYVIVHLKNGKSRKVEFSYGDSFLSQSARFIAMNEAMESIAFFDREGQCRLIQ
ncbi:VCBS repeat-containing protein [Agriterribacter sp.]|uniref:VCBS repeat-containing protein n=1 Tax=Agriterribacter sp. TaxID=2821509 RepID=UPI002C7F3FD0|nr:VCBS repeat-containing protein [Agriterribacter sp.]HRO45767.1 VCBS repeat-containing protein [Agriterribacter sp.]HRQ16778.1 VCBS repeat-containing protein [Agriterribacter sp.]